jgi:hypothetical protein
VAQEIEGLSNMHEVFNSIPSIASKKNIYFLFFKLFVVKLRHKTHTSRGPPGSGSLTSPPLPLVSLVFRSNSTQSCPSYDSRASF